MIQKRGKSNMSKGIQKIKDSRQVKLNNKADQLATKARENLKRSKRN